MRINLVFAITLMAIMQVSASSFGQKISINEKNSSLSSILKSIRAQSGYDVLFDAKIVQNTKPIDIYLKNASIDEALNKCLSGLNLSYKLEENTVIIREKSIIEKIGDEISYRLAVNEIKGYVFAKNGREPLSGASITVQRTKRSTYSDHKGVFTLKDVLPSDSLIVSYIGYKSITVISLPQIYISLEEASNPLDVLVIQGYGKTTQRLATGNITRVGASTIGKQLVDNPLLALQGEVPGLQITSLDGKAFSNQRIELRGRKSINSNISSEPLIIIDGVPQTVLYNINDNKGASSQSVVPTGMQVSGSVNNSSFSPLYNLNPNDIESIEVLKDADATAIYGSRAGNGVILISTKKGKSGKTMLNAKVEQGMRTVINNWDLLGTEQYLAMRKEAFKNDGKTPTIRNAPELLRYDQNRYTDWQDFSYGGTGKWSSYDVGVTGGDARTKFRISSSLGRNTDISNYSGLNQRLSNSLSLSHQTLDNKLRFDASARFSNTKNTQISSRPVHLTAPNAPAVFDEKGDFNFVEWQTTMSEFVGLRYATEIKGNAINANAKLEYTPVNNLNLSVNVGYNSNNSDSRMAVPLSTIYRPLDPSGEARLLIGRMQVSNLIIEPQATYNIVLGKGKLTTLIGASYQDNSTRNSLLTASKFSSDEQMNSVNAAAKFVSTEGLRLYKYTGVFARVNYNWQDKYIVNLNGRRDGSSRFGADYRFGNFGAVGATWILSNEQFIKSNLPKAISFVKLRGSMGIVGSDGIGDYRYLTQWGHQLGGTPIPSYEGMPGAVPQLQPNSEFRWQKNTKSEVGLDLAFFKEALDVKFSYYTEFTGNQLLQFPTPIYTGFNSLVYNSPAQVRNSGIELSIVANVINKDDFSWMVGFNFSRNRNVLEKYPDFENSPYFTNYKIGKSLNTIYLLKGLGVNSQTGKYEYFDANGDGKVQNLFNESAGTNGDDRIIAVNTSPDFFGGMSHSFRFKGLMLSANFFYSKQMALFTPSANGSQNISVGTYKNTWHNAGDKAKYAKFTNDPDQSYVNYSASSMAYVPTDFLRLKTLQLSYNLSGNGLKVLGLSNLSINATGQNIFVLSKYDGLDPEVLSDGGMPQTRTITMGLNCSF